MQRLIAWLLEPSIRQWATIFAGMVQTILAIWLILILWRGGWPIETALKRIDFLGSALILCLCINGLVIVSLSGARFSARGPLGTGFQADPGADATKAIATVEGVIRSAVPDTPPKEG